MNNAMLVFKEFCENSSFHGIRYFTARNWIARVWWIFAFGVSAWFCGSSIKNILVDWYDNPMTLGFADNPAHILKIPYPTVTICPETKTFARKLNISTMLYTLWDNQPLDNISEIELKRMECVFHICEMDVPSNFGTDFTNASIYDVMSDIALNINYLMNFYESPIVSRKEFEFSELFTDEGICYAFNALNSHEIYTDEMAPEIMTVNNNPNISHWSLEGGYSNEMNEHSYPARVFNARPKSSLVVSLRVNKEDLNNNCNGWVHGFRIYLHLPGETFGVSRKYFQISLQESAELSVKPTMITTVDGLRGYRPSQRQCFFGSERQLRFFKIYTSQNCETECLANFTKQECGCVKFSMPRDRTTPICGTKKIDCYKFAEQKLFDQHTVIGLKNNFAKAFLDQCNCLASCTSVSYDGEIDRLKISLMNEHISNTESSIVRIIFRDHQVITLKRSETYTITNFLSVCGGLLGLFLGVSALSIIEIIYYATIRLVWSIFEKKFRNTVKPFNKRNVTCIFNDSYN